MSKFIKLLNQFEDLESTYNGLHEVGETKLNFLYRLTATNQLEPDDVRTKFTVLRSRVETLYKYERDLASESQLSRLLNVLDIIENIQLTKLGQGTVTYTQDIEDNIDSVVKEIAQSSKGNESVKRMDFDTLNKMLPHFPESRKVTDPYVTLVANSIQDIVWFKGQVLNKEDKTVSDAITHLNKSGMFGEYPKTFVFGDAKRTRFSFNTNQFKHMKDFTWKEMKTSTRYQYAVGDEGEVYVIYV